MYAHTVTIKNTVLNLVPAFFCDDACKRTIKQKECISIIKKLWIDIAFRALSFNIVTGHQNSEE
jgi:hypothetical protein